MWSLPRLLLFRFFFAFCVVLLVPVISGILWGQLIEWTGPFFFGKEVTYHPSGSGDTLNDYAELLLKFLFSLIAVIIWSVLDRRRGSYNKLLYWQEVYIRYYLAFFMIVYGFMKVIKLQFSAPGLSSLLLPLGTKSPMGLAWTFMGLSDTYTIFSGFCEVLAASFLLYRKTRTLGALIAFGVMLNVFLMNMSYDIPVKIFSFRLVVLAGFLVALDYKRLLNLFILNRATLPQSSLPHFPMRWANTTTTIVKLVAIVGGVGFMIFNNIQDKAMYGDTAPKPAMYGIYEIDTFIRNNDTIPAILNDTIRWRYLVIERESVNIFHMKTSQYDDLDYFEVKTDSIKKEMVFSNYDDSTKVGSLRYSKMGKNKYTFKGVLKNDSIELHTIRTDEKDYMLTNRGFRWVSEYPYNW